MRKFTHMTSVIFLSLFLAGCQYKKTFYRATNLSPKESAILYIYRTDIQFHSLDPAYPFFFLDGKQIGKLGTGDEIKAQIAPGKHQVSVKSSILFMPGKEIAKVTFEAKPDKTYYIRYSEEMGNLIMGNIPVFTSQSSLRMATQEEYQEKR